MTEPPFNTFRKNIPKDLRYHMVKCPVMNQAQLDAMAGLMGPFGPDKVASIYQTWTEEGGIHTYIALPDRIEYHIAKNGNVLKMGAVGEEVVTPTPEQSTGVISRSHGGKTWAEHAKLASEPEGRTTGLHRDSMG